MTTVTLKRYFWKDFEKTQTCKYTFLVLDTIMCIVTYPVFFPFVILFQDHKAGTKLRFYGPMIMLLGFVLTFASMIMYRHHLSWFTITGVDIFMAIILVICVSYPMWSNDYREKMGYPVRFG